MITKDCAHCGTEFEAQRSNAKYCRQSCRTMASYKRNGYVYRQGHYEKHSEKKEQTLSIAAPALPVQQGINGIEAGRAKDELTLAGAFESFLGASASNFVSHQLSKGEYDERLALLQKTLNQVLHEFQKQNEGNKSLIQANKGINIPKLSHQPQGMPAISFPDGPMM